VEFVGLENYTRILADDVFWKAVGNTLIYAFWVVLLTLGLAVTLAVLFDQKLRGRTLYRTAFYLPHVTSTAAVSVLWIWIYSPQFGLLNAFLGWFGIPRQNWLGNPDLALYSIIIMSVWMAVGSYMVLFLAGLQNIPPELYEAARIDGANGWNLFRSITLPLLKPVTFLVLVMCMIKAFQVFEQVYIMTAGGPGYATTTVAHQIFKQAFESLNLGYASAMAFLLFVLIFMITLVQNRLFKWDNANA
jgi:ABC-type sugar transport system permease subunit